ncbi:MAG: hypothetical protein GX446_09305 [Chthonomonadales bacterium]|nr:hypothetical protein [Chthonomonadales bacterium]
MRLRDFNGFILSSIALFVIAIGGIIKGNRWLSEPGMPTNEHGWQLYLVASAVMLINGIISIRVARRAEQEKAALSASSSADPQQKSST